MQSYANFLQTYHDLHPSFVPSISALPSPLEALRYVGKNRPFVVRGGANDWPALKARRWDVEYLKKTMGDAKVKIAVTPLGNADAPVELPNQTNNNTDDGSTRHVFVQPAEEIQRFDEFIDRITSKSDGAVEYAQSQNDNLRSEYLPLLPDVQPDISWASTALAQKPEAINIWIGTDRSTTALHKDNYENIYVQIIGQKHFVLLPPIESPCVNEVMMAQGVYERNVDEHGHEEWSIKELTGENLIPVALWDPDQPERSDTKYSSMGQPLRVTLEPGDMLYLPCTWYHKVTQTCGDQGICVAVNYWYDMDFEGLTHSATTFIRDIMTKVDELDSSNTF